MKWFRALRFKDEDQGLRPLPNDLHFITHVYAKLYTLYDVWTYYTQL